MKTFIGVLVLFFSSAVLATNPHTFQPLPSGAQACFGQAALHNPHCTGGSTVVDPSNSGSTAGSNNQQQSGSRDHRVNPGAYVMAFIEIYFYFAICQVEQEQNPDGWFAQNCWYPNWGPVTAPMPGMYSN